MRINDLLTNHQVLRQNAYVTLFSFLNHDFRLSLVFYSDFCKQLSKTQRELSCNICSDLQVDGNEKINMFEK